MSRTDLHRITALAITFDRIGPVPARRPRVAPTFPGLVVAIPPHTARNIDATIGYLTRYAREHVRMYLPADTDRFTVSVDITAGGDGTVLVDGGRNGHGTIRNVDLRAR